MKFIWKQYVLKKNMKQCSQTKRSWGSEQCPNSYIKSLVLIKFIQIPREWEICNGRFLCPLVTYFAVNFTWSVWYKTLNCTLCNSAPHVKISYSALFHAKSRKDSSLSNLWQRQTAPVPGIQSHFTVALLGSSFWNGTVATEIRYLL